MSVQVFSEKLRPPEPGGLSRARLERPILATRSDLSLVVAPAGSGKSTLLAHVARASSAPVAWYRTDSEDVHEDAFVTHLRWALSRALGESLPDFDTLDELLGTIDEWRDRPITLIIDDLQEVGGSPAERALERFLTLRPPSIRILLGSRRLPDLNTSRLLVSGGLTELDGDDLRFRTWEVEELFRTVFAEPLTPEAAAALTSRTEGWAAALQLFHLATSGKSIAERERAVADLSGRSRGIRSYLTRNVLAELEDGRRRFLLRTCTLGTLSGELCDALLETRGNGAILEELERQQLFTTSDDDGRTYRYHQVLQSHLEVLLVDELGSDGARAWYSRSADVLMRAGAIQQALRASARAEDWDTVARLLQQNGRALCANHESGWEERLPPSLTENDPWLNLAEARRRLRGGAIEAAAACYRRASELLDEPDFRQQCAEERAVAQTWTTRPPSDVDTSWTRLSGRRWLAARVRAATRRLSGVLPENSLDARPPNVAKSGGSPSRAVADAMIHLLAGRPLAAQETLNSATCPPPTDTLERLVLSVLDVVAAELCGDDIESPARLEDVILSAEVAGQPWIAQIARGLRATALLLADPEPWRQDTCDELLAQCRRDGDLWGELVLSLATGWAYVALEDSAADEMLARATACAQRLEAGVLVTWAEAGRGLAAARAAQTATINDSVLATLAEQARRLDAQARALGVTGARAITLATLALTATGSRGLGLTRESAAVAQECGLHPLIDRSTLDAPIPEQRGPSRPSAAGPPARLSLLGGFVLEADGKQPDIASLRPRARSLLHLLALRHGREVHRERLIEDLWPGVDPGAGRRRLQVAVSSVRHVLEGAGLAGTAILLRRGDGYCLDIPGALVDIAAFDDALVRAAVAGQNDVPAALGHRIAALELYRGELLPEEGPTDWVVSERERLRLAAAVTAADAARDSQVLGDSASALRTARRSVELDPFRDLSWVLLAELHEQAGDYTAATVVRLEHERVRARLDEAFPYADEASGRHPGGTTATR